jgi:hypothetical protein
MSWIARHHDYHGDKVADTPNGRNFAGERRSSAFSINRFHTSINRLSLSQHETALLIFSVIQSLIEDEKCKICLRLRDRNDAPL